MYSNFLCQLSGRKNLKLIPPRFYEEMYPTIDTEKKNFSYVNTNEPDFKKFPMYRDVIENVYDATLNEGEVLFLPGKCKVFLRILDD